MVCSNALTSVIFLFETESLNLGAHSTVKNDDSLLKDSVQVRVYFGDIEVIGCDVFALQVGDAFNHSVCFGKVCFRNFV